MAEIKYYPLARISPKDQSTLYYAQKVQYSCIDSRQLLQRIQENTAVPPGVIRAAVLAIADSIDNFVCNGHSVQLGDFMSLRITVQSKLHPYVSPPPPLKERKHRLMLRATWGALLTPLQKKTNYRWVKVASPDE